jgi:predicted DNA-binding transcriptional regulator AlpA
MNSQFLSPVELAHALQISLSTIYRLKAANVPPFNAYIHVGRRILFPASLLGDMETKAKAALSKSGLREAPREATKT